MTRFILSALPLLLLTACEDSTNNSPNDEVLVQDVIVEQIPVVTSSVNEVLPSANEILTPDNEILTQHSGYFVDAAVENLQFMTQTQTGKTDTQGKFNYLIGEEITFSIGNINFPSVNATSRLTPLDLFSTSDINNTSVVNSLRLLQSLDSDGNPTNGIVILNEAHALASNLDVDFSSDNFDSQVADLVANNGAVSTTLITANQAINHFQATLNELNQTVAEECSQTHNLVGSSAEFITVAHNVSGIATIIDDCTIEIENFNYDATAPAVYFYAALDKDYGSQDAFTISQQLRRGNAYIDEKIILSLPSAKSLDDLNSISVWCLEFKVNFGDLTFNSLN